MIKKAKEKSKKATSTSQNNEPEKTAWDLDGDGKLSWGEFKNWRINGNGKTIEVKN